MELKAKAVGVEIIPKGKIIYYSVPNGEDYSKGDLVLVMGDFGLEVGRVLIPVREVSIDEVGYELKAVIRKLTEEDMEQYKRTWKTHGRPFRSVNRR